MGIGRCPCSAHPHKLGAPIASSGSPTYISDTPFGSGKAIDLADGHVEVSTGESEDTFDGGSAFSVSAWVKGWPKKNAGVIVTKGATLPDPTEVPSMKLWLDSTALATMDQGNSLGATGTPTNGSNVHFWGDSSGNGYDGVRNSSNSPKYRSTSFNNGYSCVETSGGYFDISNSETDFDQWTGMTMVVAFKWTNTSTGDRLVYKGSTGWHNNVASYYIGKFNTGAGQGTGFWVADNGTKSKMNGNSYTDARSLEKIFAVKYDGSSLNSKFYINGAQVANHGMNSLFSSIPASSTSKVRVGGNYLIAELFMFDTALSDANREIIEGHLALRYGLSGYFDSSHSGISTQGWGIGRGGSSDAVSSFISNVGEYVSASSGASPSTDNQWHHVVSSYDGGTRKTYFDGTEVSSIEFSGQVTATNRTLVFGAVDFNSTAPAEEEAKLVAAAKHSGIKLDEVRFYNSALSSAEITQMYNFGKGDTGSLGGFATLPSTITGTVGTALSSTITADFDNVLYSAYNLPAGLTFTGGLSINSATGEISGTPTVGGSHTFTVIATGGTNTNPKKAIATITYSAPTSAPVFGTPGAANILRESAILRTEIAQSGSTNPYTVDFVWGNEDGGNSTLSGWDYNATSVGSGLAGYFGKEVTGLTAGDTVYYRSRTTTFEGPVDIVGNDLKLWLDAADSSKIVIDGTTGRVNTWQDKSGQGKDFSSGGGSSFNTAPGPHQPSTGTRNLNQVNVIDFDGDQFLRSNETHGLGSTWSIFFLAQFDELDNPSNCLFSFSNVNNARGEFFAAMSTSEMRARVTRNIADNYDLRRADNTPAWSYTIPLATPHILTVTYKRTGNTSTNSMKIYVDGVERGSNNLADPNGNSYSAVNANNRLVLMNYRQIGVNDSAYTHGFRNQAMDGFIGEVIATTTTTTDTERLKMEKYLETKWGMDILPSTHDSLGGFSTAWSDVQTFTTPISLSAPELGTQSTSNLDTTSADMEVNLVDNGNDPTTVVFFYGDNDGGTTPSNWDNNVTISNAQEGTLRASVSGLTSGQTYHFRTRAQNSAPTNSGYGAGIVWATNKTSFTTVTSSVREDTDAVRYSDLEGWWKLDGDYSDSSGNNRHGLPGWSPNNLADLEIWVDASDDSSFTYSTSNQISAWKNKIGSTYTFDQKTGTPLRVTGGPNGHSVVQFDGADDALWTDTSYDNTDYTVLVVARQTGAVNGRLISSKTANWLLGYHQGDIDDFVHNGWLYNGSTSSDTDWHLHVSNQNSSDQGNGWLDFVQKVTNSNGANTSSQPGKFMFGAWRNTETPSAGEVAEFIVYDRVLSSAEREIIEGYLANKWDLDIPTSHNHSLWRYSQYDNPFASDTPNDTGKSLDLSNGVSAIVQTGGTEDVFDGGSAFSTSLWVKGWPALGSKILSKDTFNPGQYGALQAWFEGTDPSSFSTTADVGGPTPSSGDDISIWYDKAGNGHHARVTSGSAKYSNSALKGDTVGVLTTGVTALTLDDSATAFDQWSKMTIFMLYEWDGAAGTTWQSAMHKGGTDWSSTSWILQTMNNNSPNTQGTGFLQGNTAGNGSYRLNGNNKTYASANNPKIIVARYDGSAGSNHMKLYANGDFATQTSSHATMRANPNSTVVIGGASHDYGEIMIFKDALSDSDRKTIEGYIAHKYGIESLLVSGHPHQASSADPQAEGWSVKAASANQDDIVLNLYGAGGEYSKPVPVNDGNWHHLATTYDGSNKKVYIDGVQVATAAQTGSVTAADFRLTIGDLFTSLPDQPKIDDVRIYGVALTADEVAAIYNEGENDVGAQKFSVTSPSTIKEPLARVYPTRSPPMLPMG